jgi:hypothetical protein
MALAQSLKDADTWTPLLVADAFGTHAPARQPLQGPGSAKPFAIHGKTMGCSAHAHLPRPPALPNRYRMAESPAERIEQALARIEAAAAARAYATARLATRHAKLRARIEEAVTSLDALIARETSNVESE